MSRLVTDRLSDEFLSVSRFPTHSITSRDVVVIFCAEETDVTGENGQRIIAGIEIAIKAGKPIIFLGTSTHIASLSKYLKSNRIDLPVYYPSQNEDDNTLTQSENLLNFLTSSSAKFNKILIVSSYYHIPRIRRYCSRFPKQFELDYFPVGDYHTQLSQTEQEKEKIIRYAAKGDLSLFVDN